MSKTTSTYFMATAKKMVLEDLLGGANFIDASIGKTGPDSYDFLIEVPNPTDESADLQEVYVTVKLTAHKYFGTESREAYNGFQAVQDYKEEVEAKEQAARIKKEEKERKKKSK